jgi:hypothetical protein
MARLVFVLISGEISALGALPYTLCQLIAPANQRVVIREASISFKGVSNTASPAICDVGYQSTAGTSMGTLTPSKWNSSDSEAIQSTAIKAVSGTSTDPTEGNILIQEEIHPQTGYTWQSPFAGEIVCPGGSRIGTRAFPNAAVTVVGRNICEE